MATVLEPSLAHPPAPDSSDRSFGLMFAAVFALIGGLPLLHLAPPRWWAFAVAVAFALLALVRPALLHSANRAWLAFGTLVHRVVSPLVVSRGALSERDAGRLDHAAARQGRAVAQAPPRPDELLDRARAAAGRGHEAAVLNRGICSGAP